MLKKIFLLSFSLLLSYSLSQAEEQKKVKVAKKEVYTAEWQTIYGGDEDDIAYGIVALDDGDSAIVGTCKSYGAKRTDEYLRPPKWQRRRTRPSCLDLLALLRK